MSIDHQEKNSFKVQNTELGPKQVIEVNNTANFKVGYLSMSSRIIMLKGDLYASSNTYEKYQVIQGLILYIIKAILLVAAETKQSHKYAIL
jgi:hypothetical protein